MGRLGHRLVLVATAVGAALAASGAEAVAAPTDLPGFTLVAGIPHDDPSAPPADIGDGGPATAAWLGMVSSLHLSRGGDLLVTEVGPPGRIRVIAPDGEIDTLRDADIDTPTSVVGSRGAFAVADSDGGVSDSVRVFAGSDVTTIRPGDAPYFPRDLAEAGPGPGPYTIFFSDLWVAAGDEAGLLHQMGTWQWDPFPAVMSTGISERVGVGAYVTTAGTNGDVDHCHVSLKISSDAPAPVAGTGECAQEAEATATGRPATAVSLGFPRDVEATPDGGLVIVEQTRVSRVAPDGTFSVIYDEGFGGDQPRPQPDGIEVTPDGDVLFSLGTQIFRYDGNYVAGSGGGDEPPVTLPPGPIAPAPVPPPSPPPAPPAAARVAKPKASLARSSYRVVRGRRLRLSFNASQAGRFRLDVVRRGKRVKRVSGRAKRGANTVAFRVALRPGAYRLALRVGAGRTLATDTAALVVRRR